MKHVGIYVSAFLCSIALLFSCGGQQLPKAKGSAKLVTRDFLVKGTLEKRGYGAYSYILLPKEPSSDQRYVALLAAYLALPRDESVSQDQRITSSKRRNLTYVPVTEAPSSSGNLTQWLNEHYDVSRAASLLFTQGLSGSPGPFIVTYTEPLSYANDRVCAAVLDLSAVPAQSMQPWLEHFARASERPQDWAHLSAARILLEMHDILAELGDGVQTTVRAMGEAGKFLCAGDPAK